MAARTALGREERSRQGEGWVKKEEEMTRRSQEKPGAAGKQRSSNVPGKMERRRNASQLKAVEQPWGGEGRRMAEEHGSRRARYHLCFMQR